MPQPIHENMKLMLGRMDSRFILQDLTLNIDAQNTLTGQTYMILELVSVQLPITRVNFIRIWKTLLLRQVQNIYYREKGVRPMPKFYNNK